MVGVIKQASEMEEMMIAGKTISALADNTARLTGKPSVFIAVCLLTAAWLLAGPISGWSDAWQLVANTVTNVVTFLMVFVIQNSAYRFGESHRAHLPPPVRAENRPRRKSATLVGC